MPMIRCARCGAYQYVPGAHAARPDCVGCGHQLPVTRKALIDPVIAAGVIRRTRMPGATRRRRLA